MRKVSSLVTCVCERLFLQILVEHNLQLVCKVVRDFARYHDTINNLIFEKTTTLLPRYGLGGVGAGSRGGAVYSVRTFYAPLSGIKKPGPSCSVFCMVIRGCPVVHSDTFRNSWSTRFPIMSSGRSSDSPPSPTAFPLIYIWSEQWLCMPKTFPSKDISAEAGLQRRARPGFAPDSLFIHRCGA